MTTPQAITITDYKLNHFELIQGVINRMAANSFMIKGWSVTLVSALFALAAKDADARYVLLSFFPAVAFWGLDGYFLYQERLFRNLYEKIRLAPTDTDFSMSTKGLWDWKAWWPGAMFAPSLLIFHVIVLLTIGIVKCHLSGR